MCSERRQSELRPAKRKNRLVCIRVLMAAAAMLLSLAPSFAQRGGGAPTGGGPIVGFNKPGGVDEKDDLKDFHHAMAVQATAQQTEEFRAIFKSTEAASRALEELARNSGKTGDAPVADPVTALRLELEKARNQTSHLLAGFSPEQKAGLKEITAKLMKAESELAEQQKTLETGSNAGPDAATSIAAHPEALRKALSDFRTEQESLAVEMGIILAEAGQNVVFNVPSRKLTVRIAGQPISIAPSAVITRASGTDTYKVEATTNLADLQDNIAAVLGSMLNQAEPCGERITVQDATLEPTIPSSLLVVRLHYERWVCSSGFAGQTSREMAEGNAAVETRLTPEITSDGQVRMVSEIVHVEAERFFDDLLRSGTLGSRLREQASRAVLSAIVTLGTALPPGVGDTAKPQIVRFESPRQDELAVVVSGELRLSDEQASALDRQLKQQAASQPVPASEDSRKAQ